MVSALYDAMIELKTGKNGQIGQLPLYAETKDTVYKDPALESESSSADQKATVIFEMVLNQHVNRGDNIFGGGIWCYANAKFESGW